MRTLQEALDALLLEAIDLGRPKYFEAEFAGESVLCTLVLDGRARVICQVEGSRVMHRWIEETNTVKVWEELICSHCGHVNSKREP